MNKKTIKYASIVICSCVLLFGCTKEKSLKFNAQFQGYTEHGNAKVHLNSVTPVWDDGDQILVNNVTGSVNSSGEITISITDDDDGYGMVYPASSCRSISHANGTIILPPTQEYELIGSYQKINAPMAAWAKEDNVKFYNLCGLLKFSLTNNMGGAITVRKIELTSSATICGKYNFQINSTTFEPGALSLRTDYARNGTVIVLDCQNLLPSIGNGGNKDFYLYVPPFSEEHISFAIYLDFDGYEYVIYRSSSSDLGIGASELVSIPITVSSSSVQKTGALTGTFSVSDSKKIRFSMGNLVRNGSNYDFEANQYNAVTVNHLFGWGTGATPSLTTTDDSQYGPEVINSTLDWDITSSYEWGSYSSSAQNWFTLSKTEWEYLFTNTTNRGSTRYAFTKVGGRRGILLFPDNYSDETYSLTINDVVTGFPEITVDQFIVLQKKGVVFLPFGGYREETTVNDNVKNFGYYWTRTSKSGDSNPSTTAWVRYFRANGGDNTDGGLGKTQIPRHRGCCVRLVREIE